MMILPPEFFGANNIKSSHRAGIIGKILIAEAIGAVGIGVTGMSLDTNQKDSSYMNKTKIAVRDSFDISAKKFDELNQRVDAKTLTWQQALDSLKVAKQNTARTTVRDSFNLSAKKFDELNQRVISKKLTWKQALDSITVARYLKRIK